MAASVRDGVVQANTRETYASRKGPDCVEGANSILTCISEELSANLSHIATTVNASRKFAAIADRHKRYHIPIGDACAISRSGRRPG